MKNQMLARFIPAAFALLLAACQPGAGQISFEGDKPIADDVQAALRALPRAEVISMGAEGVPAAIVGDLGAGPGQRIDIKSAASAIDENMRMIAPVFRLQLDQLALARVSQDELGYTHARYVQTINGQEVVGGEIAVHVNPQGTVIAAESATRGRLSIDPTPSLAGDTAVGMAWDALGSDVTDMGFPRLAYVRSTGTNEVHLAWEAVATGMNGDTPIHDIVYVDAHTGAVVDRHPQIHSVRNRKTYDANNRTQLPGTLTRSEGQAAVGDTALDAAHDYAGQTYNSYMTRWGRDSFDGNGATITSTVHYSNNYVNAFWNGTQMVYGDGDGVNASPLSEALDVVAHELTHAVTSYSANLIYQNESGALNEAMSDIMAAVIEYDFDGGVITADTWKVGEDIWTPGTAGDALRYMDNPTADGQSYDYYPERYTGTGDNGGVHINSGIANLAFYLMVEGGTHPRNKTTINVPSIGMDKAAAIFYRALTVYMTSTTNFEGARTATAQAATDLYTTTEVDAVHAAWDAVGAPGGATQPPPPPPGGGLTEVTNGQTLSGLSGATGGWDHYFISVPEGATDLSFVMSGGTGDADIYVKFGSQPTSTSYDFRPYKSGNSETVTIAAPSAGDYYFSLNAYSSYSSVSVAVNFTAPVTEPPPPPPPAEGQLSNGVPVTGLAAATGEEIHYFIDIPAGGTDASFKISGGTGDADMYVKFGSAPTTTSYDYRPYLTGNNETANVAAPTEGRWYIMVRAYSAFSGVELVASFTDGGSTPPPPPPSDGSLENGVPVTGLSGAAGNKQYFIVHVPAGTSKLYFNMSGGTGDADLYVKKGADPTTTSYDKRSWNVGNTESITINNPAADTYHIMVNAYSAYSGASLTVSWQ